MITENRKAKDAKIEELLVAHANANFACGVYYNDDANTGDEWNNLLKNAEEAKAALLDAIEASVLKPHKTIDCDASYEKTSILR